MPLRGAADDAAQATSDVIDVALHIFATHGFEDTRLDQIAHESGMSKRMIHYHFTDKRGLYIRALQRAIELTRPSPFELACESPVPADGIRHIVSVLYDTVQANPEAARMIVMENVDANIDLGKVMLADQSQVLLNIERMLMVGHDAGAFRPGVTAIDLYEIIISQCLFQVAGGRTFKNLYGIDFDHPDNQAGRKRLLEETVLAFLTSQLPTTGLGYLKPSERPGVNGTDSYGDIYSQAINEPGAEIAGQL